MFRIKKERNALRLEKVYNSVKVSGISEIMGLDRLIKSTPPRKKERERRLPLSRVRARFRVNENGDIVENPDYMRNPRANRRYSLNEDGDIVTTV